MRRTSIACLILATFAAMVWWNRIRTTMFDRESYDTALTDGQYHDVLWFFPREFGEHLIPLKLAHQCPRRLGGGYLQLLCEATDGDAIWNRHRSSFSSTWQGSGPGTPDDRSDPPRSPRPLRSLRFDGRTEALPDDWEIGVVQVAPVRDATGQGTHGAANGIAINRRDHLLLFWAEAW